MRTRALGLGDPPEATWGRKGQEAVSRADAALASGSLSTRDRNTVEDVRRRHQGSTRAGTSSSRPAAHPGLWGTVPQRPHRWAGSAHRGWPRGSTGVDTQLCGGQDGDRQGEGRELCLACPARGWHLGPLTLSFRTGLAGLLHVVFTAESGQGCDRGILEQTGPTRAALTTGAQAQGSQSPPEPTRAAARQQFSD